MQTAFLIFGLSFVQKNCMRDKYLMFSPRVTDEKQPRHAESSLDLVGECSRGVPSSDRAAANISTTNFCKHLNLVNLICITVSQYIDKRISRTKGYQRSDSSFSSSSSSNSIKL